MLDPQAWVKAFVFDMMLIMAGKGRVAPFLITSPFWFSGLGSSQDWLGQLLQRYNLELLLIIAGLI